MSKYICSIKDFIKNFVYKNGYIFANDMTKLGRARSVEVYKGEYVRLSSLELVANEIYSRGIEGNVAEVGVYQGDFAKWINIAFPDRKLYLFDTFYGFDNRDSEIDIQKGYSRANEKFISSIDLVLAKMKYPENCIIKKGWFPESACEITDKFVFVSLDTDLYQAIYNGLEFFFPLLVNGGYIFVHDYNSKYYSGVKAAVRGFCLKKEIGFFPLTDKSGSAIITK
jgi:O-methyltransferase